MTGPARSTGLILAVAAIALLLPGCATPLTLQQDAGELGQAIGVPPSEIVFASYCDFGEAPSRGKHVAFTHGTLVVGRSSLYLLRGSGAAASIEKQIRFSDINGADMKRYGLGRQLQLLVGTTVVVIQITKNKALADPAGSETVRQILRDQGVRDFTGPKFFFPRPSTIIVPIPI